MYFTSLPDHAKPGFDEQLHFSKFKRHSIIFNAQGSHSYCDNHVGCLWFKTVLSGEEWYGIKNYRLAIRRGQFLILNDDQTYSCRIDHGEKVRCLSIFFKREFASTILRESLQSEDASLDNPATIGDDVPEFLQTLHDVRRQLQMQLTGLIAALEGRGYNSNMVDEYLVFFLLDLIRINQSASRHTQNVDALKLSTRTEIYKRLCIARDILQSCYIKNTDLQCLSSMACLSVPQLVRQFKAVFHLTPHQFLIQIRLRRAPNYLEAPPHQNTK